MDKTMFNDDIKIISLISHDLYSITQNKKKCWTTKYWYSFYNSKIGNMYFYLKF